MFFTTKRIFHLERTRLNLILLLSLCSCCYFHACLVDISAKMALYTWGLQFHAYLGKSRVLFLLVCMYQTFETKTHKKSHLLFQSEFSKNTISKEFRNVSSVICFYQPQNGRCLFTEFFNVMIVHCKPIPCNENRDLPVK